MKQAALRALSIAPILVCLQCCGGADQAPPPATQVAESTSHAVSASAEKHVVTDTGFKSIYGHIADTYALAHPQCDKQLVESRLRALEPQLHGTWGERGYDVALGAIAIEGVLRGNGIASDALEMLEWLNRAPWRPIINPPYRPEMFPSSIMVLGEYARLRNQSLSDFEARRLVEQEFHELEPGEKRVVPPSAFDDNNANTATK